MSSTGLLFKTPADIRAIPNQQWEEWMRTDTIPFPAFSSAKDCQMVLRWLVKATKRRMSAAQN